MWAKMWANLPQIKTANKLIDSRLYINCGGLERIRTAVGAFAEPSLAARPRDP